jgi:hypothetical protein
MAALQEAHLNGLLTARHAWSILLTDSEYYFYHVDESHWRIEPALFGRSAELLSAKFSSKDDLAWLWHIAPQFVESDSEGEIHRVEARFKGKKR